MLPAARGDLFPGSLAWSVVGAAWTWGLAVLLGAALLPLAATGDAPQRRRHPAVGRLLAWAVVGIAAQSVAWLALSAAGGLRPATVVLAAVAVTLAAALAGGPRLVRELAALQVAEPATARASTALRVAALAGIAILLWRAAQLATIPSVHYDDLVYHLGLPRQALLLGHWPSLPSFHPSLMAAGWEITYVLPLALGGGVGPQIMNLVALGLLAALAVRLGRRGGEQAAALSAAALLVTSPVFVSLGALATNDLFVGLAIGVALDRVLDTRGERPVEVGLVAGAAWAAKLTALPALLALGATSALLRPPPARARWLGAAALVAAGLCVGAGFTLRSFALTGNPVYPAFFGALGGRGWDTTAADLLAHDAALGAIPDRGPLALLLGLHDLVARSSELGTPSGLDTAFVLLALLGLLSWRRVRDAAALLAFAALAYVAWAATAMMLRFALPFLLAFVPFAAAALERLLSHVATLRGARAVEVTLAAVTLVVCVAGVTAGVSRHAQLYGWTPEQLRSADRATVLADRLDVARAARELAASLPAGARLLMIGEARLAVMPRPCVASTAIDAPAVATYLDGAASPEEVNERLLAEGITHVLLNARELERWSGKYRFGERLGADGRTMLLRWLAEGLQATGRWGTVSLHAVPPAPTRVAPGAPG
jgi:hypothetical protein